MCKGLSFQCIFNSFTKRYENLIQNLAKIEQEADSYMKSQ